jgi:3',5'-cyclic AMP phosphodiesterase CpdA
MAKQDIERDGESLVETLAAAQLSRRTFIIGLGVAGGAVVLGCAPADSKGQIAARTPAALPPLASVTLTTERTIVPLHARATPADARNSMVPTDREAMLAEGLGQYGFGPGEPVVPTMPDGSTPPASGANATQLVRFVHVTDIHLTDDESPTRLELVDSPPPLDAAARPQHPYMGRILNAAVRSVNALNAQAPIDFVLLGGDTVDSAQKNELTWAVNTLSGGGVVTCDSGAPNDPVSGSNNDPKDPFVANGLDVPWRFTVGNHDVLVTGISPITAVVVKDAVGDYAGMGTTDWTQPGGVVVQGDVVADPDREPLGRDAMIALVKADGDAHGLGSLTEPDKGNYVLDVGGTNLRFVVYDTACEAGGANGIVRKSDVDAFLKPALDQAKADGKWVVLVSHHPLEHISDGSEANAEAEADAMAPADVRTMFLSYGNILASICGHTHCNVVSWVGDAPTAGFWQVQTCSLVEYPNWMRVIEIRDEDNGYLSLQLVGLEFATDDDPVAEAGRTLAVLDYVSGWSIDGSTGELKDRNVKLYVPKPV